MAITLARTRDKPPNCGVYVGEVNREREKGGEINWSDHEETNTFEAHLTRFTFQFVVEAPKNPWDYKLELMTLRSIYIEYFMG